MLAPTMQAGQDSWMGLVTRSALGVWGFLCDSWQDDPQYKIIM
jgi:hypothetical protein